MKINIIAVGTKMPAWTKDAYGEFVKRMPSDIEVVLKEVPAAKRSKNNNTNNYIKEEFNEISKRLTNGSYLVVLDVKGKSLTTLKLAERLSAWQVDHSVIDIVIGGPDGISKELLNKAREKISLSLLTFPHPLVRVILIEQLYRAYAINIGHPYHRE